MSFLDKYSCEEQQAIIHAQRLLMAKRKIIAEWEQKHNKEAIGHEYEEYYYKRLKEMGF